MRRLPLIPAVAFAALGLAVLPLQTATALDGVPSTTERFDVSTPTAAAIEVSEYRFGADGAQHVVVSRDDLFPDSLAGSALTGTGPLLFTATDAMSAETRTELDRVLPDGGTVYLLGGTVAISAAVEAELTAAGYDVIRLEGPTRVETSVAVADEAQAVYNSASGRVLLARAYSPDDNPTAAWADSITGGGFAATSGTPLLVTPTEELHPVIDAWLDTNIGNRTTTLLGGTAALSAAVFNAAPNPERVAGPAREDTAVAISQDLWQQSSDGPRGYIVINGYAVDGWAYGLAAGSLAATTLTPLVVTHPDVVPQVTLDEIDSCTFPQVDLTVFGSTALVSDQRVTEMDAVDPRADCTADADADGADDSTDNCVGVFNPRQEDINGDGEGEMCDADIDNEFIRTLNGAEEVGGGDPDAVVEAVMRTNETDGIVCIDWVSTTNLTLPPSGAHVHIGAAGTNGDIQIIWNVLPGEARDAECHSELISVITAINDDPAGYYLNVHNTEYPNGAVRAQLA